MRIVKCIAFAILTAALVIILNTSLLLPAALGKLLSPQHGIWQNAESATADITADLKFPQLNGKTEVYFDERLVPHIFAEQENDAYFVQGFLHAKFRLWQMELQAFAAGGRVSEILGDKGLNHDREFRRLGMVYAAEIAEKEMNKDAALKAECDAYTAGVNAYIDGLTESTLPLEYKLIGYKPEHWSNLKTALFLKYMCYDLSAHEDDFEMTNARNYFSASDFAILYPAVQDSLDPIIPKGTPFAPQKIFPKAPLNADTVYFKKDSVSVKENEKPDKANGSNNWAVSGKKTASGAPILCNDPHLGLNLPSLWYEVQISTPAFNAYGVSFPGAPGVVIGFNDSCAFGVTNGGRDVRDYYEVQFKDDSRQEYLFNGVYQSTKFRIDTIKIKAKPDYIDSVAYVQLGKDWCPVMFDKSFGGVRMNDHKYYAVRWSAHDPSTDLKYFNLINRAKNYADYQAAAVYFSSPGQNCAFACKNGDIAIRTQGNWPAKWKGQGDFVMPGADSSYLWQGMIPQDEVPFQYNPERGFISSANQKPVDETYPYYIGRNYPMYRGIEINRRLKTMYNITPLDMMNLQTDNYNPLAEMALPLLFKGIRENELSIDEKKYFELLKTWNLKNDVGSKGATIFETFWANLQDTIFNDEFAKAPGNIMHPFESSLLEGLLKDSAYKFLDNINTPGKETLADEVMAAFKKTAVEAQQAEKDNNLEWEKNKATHVDHLAKIAAFSRFDLPVGGSSHNINATKQTHGPSWRMVVSLTPQTEAYGIYPGGQSGNPGSRYYDNFINGWADGKYYRLWVMTKEEKADKRIQSKIIFSKA